MRRYGLVGCLFCGWVLWRSITVWGLPSEFPPSIWQIENAHETLDNCKENRGIQLLMFKNKEPEPNLKYELKGSRMMTETTDEKGKKVTVVEELKCFPGTIDPRPRFKE